METRGDPLSREAEIEEVMRTTNLMRIEAAAAVAARYGEDVSCIVGPGGRPLTVEERARLGLDYSFADYDPDLDEFKPAAELCPAADHR